MGQSLDLLIELSLPKAQHNWNSKILRIKLVTCMLQFPKLTLYNEINLWVRFQDYFSHIWEHSDLALLWKIRLKREQTFNQYLCQNFDNMNYWGFVFLLFFDTQQPIFLNVEPYYTVDGLLKWWRKSNMLSCAVIL